MKKIFLFLLSLSLLIGNWSLDITHAKDFPDVSSENPHYQSILELQSRGIIQGYPDGTFRPEQTINRVEFLKILVETKGDYSPDRDGSGYDIYFPVGLGFSDVQGKGWFVPYIRYALKQEIIHGYPDQTFRPEQPINLAEALKMLYTAFNIPTVQFIRAPDNWYDYYTTGLPEDFEEQTTLNAKTDIGKNITRGEMASLIMYFEARSKTLNQ